MLPLITRQTTLGRIETA